VIESPGDGAEGHARESTILHEALLSRARTGEERRKLDLAWTDFERGRGRGEKTTFAEILVRRRLLTPKEIEGFLAAERSHSGTGSAVLAPSPPPAASSSNAAAYVLVFVVVAALAGAGLVKVTPTPGPPGGAGGEAAAEARRQDDFGHALSVALHEGTGGDAEGAEAHLREAAELARTPVEQARIQDVRSRIAAANAASFVPDAPSPSASPRPGPPASDAPPLPGGGVQPATSPLAAGDGTPAPPASPPPSAPASASGALAPVPRDAPPPPPTLNEDESQAVAYCATQLLELARFCSRNKAYREARSELETALALAPDDKACQKELDDLGDLASGATKYFRENYEHERSNAHARAALRLSDLALGFKKAGNQGRSQRWVDAIQEHFPGETTEKALRRLGLVYFEPYLLWTEPTDAKRYEAGCELVEGEWKDAANVATLNARHATWSDPWVVSDGVYELRTTVSLRLARRVLAQASAYRTFFLGQLGRVWDLRAPAGKLPIILARNQQDWKEQIDAESKNLGFEIVAPQNAAAFYVVSDHALDPCFVTLEARTLEGNLLKFGWDNLLLVLKHELTHQIAWEYSRYDDQGSGLPEKNFWAVEAIANFMCFYANDRGHWHLLRPKTIPTRSEGTYAVSPFAWCQEHLDDLPRLEDYFETPPERFMNESCYSMATCVAYFLLFGEQKRYRGGFLDLLERVHKHRAGPNAFAECFPGVDLAQLNRQFIRFTGGIALDE
jgi:hypothetical protein